MLTSLLTSAVLQTAPLTPGLLELPASRARPPRVSTFRLDPATNLNHVAVVALGRENEAGPVITVIHKAINPSGGN
jgi:hypothetical protein